MFGVIVTDRPDGAWYPRLNALIRRVDELAAEVRSTLDAQVALVTAEITQVDATIATMTSQIATMQAQIAALQPPPV